jgi:E3 ubiquitin-protein ligase HERC3
VGGLPPSYHALVWPGGWGARRTSGGVYCWGTSTCGDFGVPDAAASNNLIPSPVTGVTSAAALMKSDSLANTECVIQDAGTLTCWGDNWFGQAGHTPEPYPPTCSIFGGIAAPSVVAGIGNVTSVSVSFNMYTCATDSAGKVYCWGSDISGTITPPVTDGGSVTTTPTQVALGTTAKALKVVTGDANACALLDDGTIRCCGTNGSGQNGNGAIGNAAIAPTAANVNTNAANVYAGSQIGGALLKDGSLVLWGYNQSGELGHAPGQGGDVSCGNNGQCNPSPTVVTGLP